MPNQNLVSKSLAEAEFRELCQMKPFVAAALICVQRYDTLDEFLEGESDGFQTHFSDHTNLK